MSEVDLIFFFFPFPSLPSRAVFWALKGSEEPGEPRNCLGYFRCLITPVSHPDAKLKELNYWLEC